jgi:ParB family chromosome partitioning protein
MSLNKNRSLGRGLASLIPESALDGDGPDDRPNLRVVPIDEIRPNPNQPREAFDEGELAALADSIRQHGILAPLVVRRSDGHYVLIAGERRWRASARAGLTQVPVIVREADAASQQLELALVENLLRTDLDPIEAARGYQKLIDQYGYTQDEVAQRVGKDRSTVANALRLLKLPEFVLVALRERKLTAGHARALLAVNDTAALQEVVSQILTDDWSVRATEQWVARWLKRGEQKKTPTPPSKPVFEYATRTLTDALHAPVEIRPRPNGSGAILIGYADKEDLERLIERLRGNA